VASLERQDPASLLQREKDRKRGWRGGETMRRGDGEAERFGGAGVEGVLVAWEGALVVGGADESMRGRDDEVVPGKTGRRRGGASGGAGALTEVETRVPTSLLQREKDRKRGSSSILDSPSSIHLVLPPG
jgi:hypothetical protein